MNILLDRRRLLLGLAAASAAAAAPVAVSAAVPSTPENPDLLRLGDMLLAHEAELIAAHDEYEAALATATKHWPLAPDLILWAPDCTKWKGDLERGPTGGSLARGEHQRPHNLIETRCHDRDIKSIERAIKRAALRAPGEPFSVPAFRGKFPMAEWVEKLAELTGERDAMNAYEADKAMVLAASGLSAAKDRRDASIDAIERLITSIMQTPETSMAGVIIKANALSAWGRIDKLRALLPELKHGWGAALAASLIRIAEQQPA